MFIDNFVKLCQIHGQSPTFVLNAVGIAPSAYPRWKAQGYQPSYRTLMKLADYFNVSVNDLLAEDPDFSGQKEKQPANVGELSKEKMALVEIINQMSPDQLKALYQFLTETILPKDGPQKP